MEIKLGKLSIEDKEKYWNSGFKNPDKEVMYYTGTINNPIKEQVYSYIERIVEDDSREDFIICDLDNNILVHTEGIMNFLLNEAKRQDIGTILTRDTSRISRDTSSFMRFERKFRENGIRFEYLSKPDN